MKNNKPRPIERMHATNHEAARPFPEWWKIFVALGSIAAIAPVAALSLGLQGAKRGVEKIGPLKRAYISFSRFYDCFIERLSHEVLRDVRDAPALRLMVSLSVTAVPIFLFQLFLGEPSPLLAVAFYISLYGAGFQRFVRMFSAKHIEAHRRNGYFSEKYDWILGKYIEFGLGYLYGNVPELDQTSHLCIHHREQNGPSDPAYTFTYDRMSRMDFLLYLSNSISTTLGFAPCAYFQAKGQEKNKRKMMWGMARYCTYFTATFILDWRIGVLFVLIPLLCMNFLSATIQWIQHAFYDPTRPNDYFGHTVTVIDDTNFMNEGYHLCHHHSPGLHWTEMPREFEQLQTKMKESRSLVFRDIDFVGLFRELTILKRMDVLAEKLVPWEPMEHEEKIAFLMNRTKLYVSGHENEMRPTVLGSLAPSSDRFLQY